MNKKKILHIQVLPKLSGVQKISLEILKNLSNDSYEKWILFSKSTDKGDQEECINKFKDAGVNVLLSSKLKREISFKDFLAMYEIYKLCKKEQFDIVHTHSTKPGFIGRIAAWFAKTPYIIHTVHGISFHKFTKFPLKQFYWSCEMFSSIFCDKIISVNKYYLKYFRWFKNKTFTIYNGLDFSRFLQVNNNIDKSEVKILFVGRLDFQKDPLSLLQAANIVCKKLSNVSFTIVGDGEKYKECENYIINNDLTNQIKLEGWKNNVEDYYATHDIFAMSSIYESFGLIFLEAGFYNLPVVATNVEGIPEVILNGKTGFLSNPKDFSSMASNIINLIENYNMRKEMGKEAKKRVLTLFNSKQMIDSYIKFYEY